MRPLILTIAIVLTQLSTLLAQQPLVEVHTTQPALASRMASMLRLATGAEPGAPVPECPDGGHVVIALDAAGSVSAETAGDEPYLTVDLDPPALMELFAEDVETGRMRMRAILGMAYAGFGIDYDDVAVLVDGIIEFPNQIASCRLTVTELDDGATKARVDLVPVPETRFAALVEALVPRGRSFPSLVDDDATLRFRADLDIGRVYEVVEPAWAPFAAAWTRTPEEREEACEVIIRLAANYDGTFAATIDGDGRLRVISGLSDPDAQREFVRDPAFIAQQRRSGSAGGQAEVRIEPDAIEHRGHQLTRMTLIPENPMFTLPWADASGHMNTYFGVVDEAFVSAAGSPEDAAAAVDLALDPETPRAALPNRTVLTVEARLDRLFDAFVAQHVSEDLPLRIPRRATVAVLRHQSTLSIDITYR